MALLSYAIAFLGSLFVIIFLANTMRIIFRGIRPSNWSSVEGQITISKIRLWEYQGGGADETYVKGGTAYAPEIHYGYNVSGFHYESDRINADGYDHGIGENQSQKILNKYYVGKKVRVYYNPTDPQSSILEPGTRIGQNFVFYILFGVVFLVFVIITFRIDYKIPNHIVYIILCISGAAVGSLFFYIASKGDKDYKEEYEKDNLDVEEDDLDNEGKVPRDMVALSSWQRFSGTESKQIHAEVRSLFGTKEPIPSITYRIKDIYVDSEQNLQQYLLSCLQQLLLKDDWVYALEWDPGRFRKSYKFFPHREFSLSQFRNWPITMVHPYEDNTYYALLQTQFEFGVYFDAGTHTMCIFGEKMIEEVNIDKPSLLREEIRIDGFEL